MRLQSDGPHAEVAALASAANAAKSSSKPNFVRMRQAYATHVAFTGSLTLYLDAT